jgi:two-component system response regulator ResD
MTDALTRHRSARRLSSSAPMADQRQATASVLVVDDEPTIGEIVSRYLERAGYDAEVVVNGRAALDAFARRRPDLVVLDLMMPGIDGLEVMRLMREQQGTRTAIILLTARGEESDRIAGLQLGADDYVVKPFSPAELVARVGAVLRRHDPATALAPPVEVGDLVIDPESREATRADEPLLLTQREFDLLLFLAQHPGKAFSREQLMDHVWQFSYYTDTSTVTVHIRRLRAKIERDPDQPKYIETVWGTGYRFAAA